MGLGIGKKKLIDKIILDNWEMLPGQKNFTYSEMLFLIQELDTDEGLKYLEGGHEYRATPYNIFYSFTKYLLYRNLANFDSMILITSEKGCIVGDALLEMPRDLTKYPKGIPLKDLEGKGPLWVYSFNRDTQKLEVKKCDGVEFVKEDDVYEVELTNGQKLQATGDHPFLLMDGKYKQLKDLVWLKGKRKDVFCRHYDGKNHFLKTDRLRIFSRMNPFTQEDSMIKIDYSGGRNSVKEHRYIYKSIFGNIPDGFVVHHKDRNHYNNHCKNLELMSKSNHSTIHAKYKYNNNKTCKYDSIVYNSNYVRCGGIINSIKHIGKKKVYDVVNVQDNHNFIVNGIVTANTGKSSAAIVMARQWCKLLGIKFNPKIHIAYTNADLMHAIDTLPPFSPIIADESVNFASAADWAKRENKELKKKLAQIRTKHFLFVLCYPLKIYKLEKNYLESFTNYWVDLFGRGIGAIYVKDKNPVHDTWRMKDFQKMASYTEFTDTSKIEKILKKHPNFWQIVRFPKPPAWLYDKYLKVREKNVYDDGNILVNVTKEDIHNALLIMALKDIMSDDTELTMNRVILHLKNKYDVRLTKGMVHNAIEDAKQLVAKVREKAIQA